MNAMTHFGLILIMLACCAGCGSRVEAGAQPSVPVPDDPQKANPEVAGYVTLAREDLSRREFDKAVETLERTVPVHGATDKNEATNLLAPALPLHAKGQANGDAKGPVKGHAPEPVEAARYASSMGPVEVVQGYLASATWQDRVPFVLRPLETGPLMAQTYKNTRFEPGKLRPGKVMPPDKQSASVGSRLIVTVDMSETSPERPFWRYVLERTDEGYKIDWQASQALLWEEREAAARRAIQLDNPVLEVRVLKVEESGDAVYFHVRVTNRSNKFLSGWQLSLELADPSGNYLAAETQTGFNLAAGQSQVEKIMFLRVQASRVATYTFSVKTARIDLGGGKWKDATRYYSIREVQ